MINSHIVNISLIITGFLSFLLVIFPELDLSFSQIFFTEEGGFLYKRNFIVYKVYKFLPWVTKIFAAGCVLWLVYIGFKGRNDRHPEGAERPWGSPASRDCYASLTLARNDGYKIIRSGVFFLFISAIIGPGLVVNTVFKENFGRARPAQIEFFNGTKEFTPAFKITGQCDTNCSFSSGHAAMGFFFTALAYIAGALYFNKIYLAGLVFGSAVGLSRIMMGGHFLSDVAVSAFVVLFLNHIIFILWQKVVVSLKK